MMITIRSRAVSLSASTAFMGALLYAASTARIDIPIVAAESPTGMSFGMAALRAAKLFQIAPQMEDGRPTDGGRIGVAIAFKPPSY